MATLKKNSLAQILFVMVDKTDFATQESGITAASVTGKFYGVNHGGSAAMTSGTISKAVSLVRSGLFRATLKAAETNYDYLAYRFVHISAADQVLIFQSVDNDDSDIMSALAIIQSAASDAASAAQQANSRVLLNLSRISDIASFLVVASGVQSDLYSLLSDLQSDFQSRVPKRVATDSQLSDVLSDLRSFLGAGVTLDASTMSDIRSAIAGGAGATITASDISDIASAVWAYTIGARVDSRVLLVQSRVSDAQSMLSDFLSDFQSRVPKRVATDSQLSDLHSDLRSLAATNASMVSDIDSVLASRLSDILSAAVQANSRILVNQSLISDVDSALTSRFSDLLSVIGTTGVQLNASSLSDIRSAMAAVTVTLTASDISDIASAVAAAAVTLTASEISDIASAIWAHPVGTRVDSRILVNQSTVSDIRSMLSDLQSDFQSRVPKLVATGSQLSDLHSDLRSLAVTNVSLVSDIDSMVSSRLSDILSAAIQINSRVLLNQSMASDIDSALTSRFSDLLSLLGTTGVQINASSMSDIRSAITAGGGATVSASDISDIASAVWANAIGARVDSRVLINKSVISDVQSMLSDLLSDFQSRVPKRVATDSQLSDVSSDLRSLLAAGVAINASGLSDLESTLASRLSDVLSGVQQTNSRVLVAQSSLSDIASAIVLIKAKTDALPDGVKKNTALANFPFLMVDSTDHVTPKTGLTITATRRIDGGSFSACANSATEVSSGWYSINLAAADLNGDTVAIRFAATGADTRNIVIVTQA